MDQSFHTYTLRGIKSTIFLNNHQNPEEEKKPYKSWWTKTQHKNGRRYYCKYDRNQARKLQKEDLRTERYHRSYDGPWMKF